MLDTAIDFAKRMSYTIIFLYGSKELKISKIYI